MSDLLFATLGKKAIAFLIFIRDLIDRAGEIFGFFTDRSSESFLNIHAIAERHAPRFCF
jgi:hypothetical protein